MIRREFLVKIADQYDCVAGNNGSPEQNPVGVLWKKGSRGFHSLLLLIDAMFAQQSTSGQMKR